MDGLIGDIRLENSVGLGESVKVEVFGADGRAFDLGSDVVVNINGVPGPTQFLQFATTGQHKVRVVAARKVGARLVQREGRVVAVQVGPSQRAPSRARGIDAAGPVTGLPLLRSEGQFGRPYAVAFSLVDLPDVVDPSAIGQDNGQARGSSSSRPSTRAFTAPGTRYEWDFSDGTRLTSDSPFIQHDFEQGLDAHREQSTFHVAVRVVPPDEAAFILQRSLSVVNGYALCKRLGVIVPQVFSEGESGWDDTGFSSVIAVENVEPYPLRLHARRVEATSRTGVGTAHAVTERLEPPLTVPANQTAFLHVGWGADLLPEDAIGIRLSLAGEAESDQRLPVRIEAVFDRPRLPPSARQNGVQPAQVPSSHALETSRAASERVVDVALLDTLPARTTRHDVLKRLGSLAGEAAKVRGRSRDLAAPRGRAAPCVEGEECRPTDAHPDGDCRCLYTAERRKVTIPGRFVNATKGDVVLLAGGVDSIVGNMLRRVRPVQYYDHCVMVTKDAAPVALAGDGGAGAQEITHSTVCFGRFLDPKFWQGEILGQAFPTEGVREDILKYVWPGVITQTTQNAVNGETLTDPETGVPRALMPMNVSDNVVERQGQWEIVPPLVIKPDPFSETAEVRAKLHEIADDARAQAGKAHYRLYGYSDARIVDNEGPEGANWADGTRGSMCSSFIWDTVRRHDIHLEKELEEAEQAAGVQVSDGLPDGLYVYDEAERLEAAQFVADYVETLVIAEARKMTGGLSDLLPQVRQAAQNVGNQMVNAFVNDDTGPGGLTKRWTKPGGGVTVSPDDLLHWDGPPAGVFGFYAPALYRPARDVVLPVYRWARVKGKGNLTGVVRYRGREIEQATVFVPGATQVVTDGAGRFEIGGLSVGTHELVAAKLINGHYRRAHDYAHIATTENHQDIALKASWRKVRVSGSVRWTDAHGGLPVTALGHTATLGDAAPSAERTFSVSAADGTSVRVTVALTYRTSLTVLAAFTCTLTTDGDEVSERGELEIPPGPTVPVATLNLAGGVAVVLEVSNGEG